MVKAYVDSPDAFVVLWVLVAHGLDGQLLMLLVQECRLDSVLLPRMMMEFLGVVAVVVAAVGAALALVFVAEQNAAFDL